LGPLAGEIPSLGKGLAVADSMHAAGQPPQ
jgi:hypothetical protein